VESCALPVLPSYHSSAPRRAQSIDEVLTDLIPMFLDDIEQKIPQLFAVVNKLPDVGRKTDDFLEFIRLIHSIKGSAPSFGFPFLGVICHKLEDYIANTVHFSPRSVSDIKFYLNKILEIAEQRIDPGEAAGFAIFKDLPSPIDFDHLAIDPKSLHALFIGPRDVQFRILEAELTACGIRTMVSASSFHGLELAVRTRPDFIMVANVVDVLGGMEIVSMLRAVKILQKTPIMFLKTEVGNEPPPSSGRQELPDKVRVVRKGRPFSEDFADALTSLNIL
jgi:HPt (histidine-containing phosphotransfer) domain-containing protein